MTEGITITSKQGTKSFVFCVPGQTSDGYHTFDELYQHRCILFAALMKSHPSRSWRSNRHHDGSEWEGWFIAGMELPVTEVDVASITYHLPSQLWSLLEGIPELERAPKWDGHTSQDVVERIEKWIKGITILSTKSVAEFDKDYYK